LSRQRRRRQEGSYSESRTLFNASAASRTGCGAGRLNPGALVRLLPDGRYDPAFVQTNNYTGFAQSVPWQIGLRSDGKLIVTGQFTRLNGESRPGFARLNADGSTDTRFVQGTSFGVGIPMSMLPDGNLLVGGTRFFTGVGLELPAMDLEFDLTPNGLELNWPAGY
jgi:hypothetical protein